MENQERNCGDLAPVAAVMPDQVAHRAALVRTAQREIGIRRCHSRSIFC